MRCKGLLLVWLGCWSVAASAKDPWCSARGEQVLRFEWKSEAGQDSTLGSVRVVNIADGRTLQILRHVENYGASSESLHTRDFNNDGCGDLVVASAVAGIGNESSTVFLFDRARRRFVLNKVLSDIGGLDIDPRDRNCVTGSWKGGADNFYGARHCWRKGKLVLRSAYSLAPLVDEEGNLRCYQQVDIIYAGGGKKIRKRCTKDAP